MPFLPLGPGVTPDAAAPVAWRQQAAWGYSGVEPAVVSSGAAVWAAANGTARAVATVRGASRVAAQPAGRTSSG